MSRTFSELFSLARLTRVGASGSQSSEDRCLTVHGGLLNGPKFCNRKLITEEEIKTGCCSRCKILILKQRRSDKICACVFYGAMATLVVYVVGLFVCKCMGLC